MADLVPLFAFTPVGAEPWDKLFTSLRATRDTELRESYPAHVVDSWIGHNEIVAKKNYLQLLEAHWEKAVQKAVQQPAASGCNSMQKGRAGGQKSLVLQPAAASCSAPHGGQVGMRGLEPPRPRDTRS